ncbi:hypothetical protein OAK98_04575 [Mariniblastus sp.]|nr:hypothetical protein [Mariniblastus sp.]
MNYREPTYWRMQLHPYRSEGSVRHAAESLNAGFIGLGFAHHIGDLHTVEKETLPDRQRNYWAFAHEMEIGDIVLVMARNFPFAICTVSGDYNYIREPVSELGVWFRHFRPVIDVSYYADVYINPHEWHRITMTGTIDPLRSRDSQSRRLIDEWLAVDK